jgi:threonine/homoserine/homoserine lactone efflux protein
MAFWEGMLAGYGIAVPVGAIAVLIIEVALRHGFGLGFTAGAAAASVDFLYAAIAVGAGLALASSLAPYATLLRALSAFVLMGLGGYGLWRTWKQQRQGAGRQSTVDSSSYLRTYGQFFGLTLLNPLTIVYFAALVLGRDPEVTLSSADRLAFVLGAGLASLSWQTLLAGTGATARRYLSPRFQLYASIFGNLVVFALGSRILIELVI